MIKAYVQEGHQSLSGTQVVQSRDVRDGARGHWQIYLANAVRVGLHPSTEVCSREGPFLQVSQSQVHCPL